MGCTEVRVHTVEIWSRKLSQVTDAELLSVSRTEQSTAHCFITLRNNKTLESYHTRTVLSYVTLECIIPGMCTCTYLIGHGSVLLDDVAVVELPCFLCWNSPIRFLDWPHSAPSTKCGGCYSSKLTPCSGVHRLLISSKRNIELNE